jgi:pimeloyl-ACP methyl ester carboxylesterase
MTSTKAPVVFIHGLWLHASSWQPWQELFAEAGYEPSAPGWPGDAGTVEATRTNPDSVANHGIDDVTDHYASFIEGLPSPPILIGHSFGGLIAEKLLGMDRGAAAIAIDAAQIKGVLQLPLSQRMEGPRTLRVGTRAGPAGFVGC